MFSPKQQIGTYTLVRRLGRGGFGEVWLAERRMKFVTTRVALKLPLDSEIDYDAVKQEARIWERASGHPNVVPIIEADECDGQAIIVSEYADNGSLDQLLAKSGGFFPADIAVRMTIGIVAGLEFLHSRDIIHRDVKPANVLLQGDTPRLTDFGVSRVLKASSSSLKSAGTPHYMAPEAFDGIRNAQTDIWAVGVMFYEMLTGNYPFRADSVMEIMGAIMTREPEPLPPEIEPSLRRIIAKALKKRPADRYARAADVKEDLHNLIFKTRTQFDISLHETVADGPATPVTMSFSDDQRKSIAILPFKNLSGDPAVGFYEFSLADAVTTELARLRSIVVRPSSMIAKYHGKDLDPCDAGREMSVGSILSCGFMVSGTRVRVTAQLLNVASGEIIWSDRIDTDASDIFALQDTIAQQIINGLELSLSTSEQELIEKRPTEINEAYEEYLRGRDSHARFIFQTTSLADCEAAIASFMRAVTLDPNFALAWSGLGSCYANKVFKGIGVKADYDQAYVAFKRAIELDPDIVEARVVICFVYLSRGEKNRARNEIMRLHKLFPDNPALQFSKGVMNRLDGDYESSLASWDELERVDPSSRVIVHYNRARIYSLMGDHNRAFQEIERGAAIEIMHPVLRIMRAQIWFHAGDIETATQNARDALDGNPHLEGIRPLLAMLLASQNKTREARENLSPVALERAHADADIAYWTASAYALLGEADTAFEWLQRSVTLGLEDRKWIENDKSLVSLRDDPRFERMMEGISANRQV